MIWVAAALAAWSGWLAVASHRPASRGRRWRRWSRPGWLTTRKEAARAASVESRLPLVLDMLAACLAVGSPLLRAQREVGSLEPGPCGDALRRVSDEATLGIPLHEAWSGVDDPPWAGVARDVARSAHSGDAVSATLRLHARAVRADTRSARLTAARRVGVRAVIPLVACHLPAFVLVGVVPIIAGAVGDVLP